MHAVVTEIAHISDDVLLDLLERSAATFVAWDLVHRLVPFAERLRELDYADHPWAAMPAGVAICVIDRPRGRALLSWSREHFAAADERWAHGMACYLEGIEDLGEGRVAEAGAWWEQARGLVDDPITLVRLTGAHNALGSYQEGHLATAIALAEQALWAAENAGDHRSQAVSGIYLAFFRVYVGAYRSAEQAMDRADAAFAEMADLENQYEMPLLLAERAVIRALRGEMAAAEEQFEAAIAVATSMHNEWYRAIIWSLRADFTSADDPVRAVRDATGALAYFDSIDEQWWSAWARHALARAHLASGELRAANDACTAVLSADVSPIECGRILATRAEIHERAGDGDRAIADVSRAVELLTRSGSRFWAARAHLIGATVDRRRSAYHARQARRLAGPDADDPAWAILLRGRGELRIRLLDIPEVTIDGTPVRFTTRAEIETLAMLALQPAGVSTSIVADRLWPEDDPDRVTHRVDNLVSSLRGALLPTTRLRRSHGMLALDLTPEECDVRLLVHRAEAALGLDATPTLTTDAAVLATQLRRPLLAGHEAPWIGLESAPLHRLATRLEQHSR